MLRMQPITQPVIALSAEIVECAYYSGIKQIDRVVSVLAAAAAATAGVISGVSSIVNRKRLKLQGALQRGDINHSPNVITIRLYARRRLLLRIRAQIELLSLSRARTDQRTDGRTDGRTAFVIFVDSGERETHSVLLLLLLLTADGCRRRD